MRFNIANETVGRIVKVVGGVIVYGLASTVSTKSIKDIVDDVRYSRKASYSDAIGAIMNCSSMLDSYKNEAVAVIKKDGDCEYYKTVIKIAKSNIFKNGR